MELDALRSIDKLKINTLWILKPKWYKERYELTDNAFVYANIYSKGWGQTIIFETTGEVFSICNSWRGNLTITNVHGDVLGTTNSKQFSTCTNITLSNGQTHTYYNPSMWKDEYVWEDEFNAELIRIKYGSLSSKATITFNKRAAEIPDFNMLVFLGFKLHLNNAAM
jgi:hypothetical protein